MLINYDGVQYDYDGNDAKLGSVLMVFKVDENGLGIETRFNGSLDMMKGAVQALERQIIELEAGLMPKIAMVHGGAGDELPDFLEMLMAHLTGGCGCGDDGCSCGDDEEDEPAGEYEENDEQADAAAVAAGIRAAFNKKPEPVIFESDIVQ